MPDNRVDAHLIYTSEQVAVMLKVDGSTVRKRAKRLGLETFGGRYVFTEENVAMLKAILEGETKRGPKAHGLDTPSRDEARAAQMIMKLAPDRRSKLIARLAAMAG